MKMGTKQTQQSVETPPLSTLVQSCIQNSSHMVTIFHE
jgi:hypothetical protein